MNGAPALKFSAREIVPPVTAEQLRPLEPECRVVLMKKAMSERDHLKVAEFLNRYPNQRVCISGRELTDVSFLQYYPLLSHLRLDLWLLDDLSGIASLTDKLQILELGQTKSRANSLAFLSNCKNLKTLRVEGAFKDLAAIQSLAHLEILELRSISLPDLNLLQRLDALWSLEIKLGGTKDLRLLPEIGCLKYLELWMVKGLQDVSAIGEIPTLQNLFLQALKNVTALPSFSKLRRLRRVTLDTMKGISDLSPIADAPALEELFVVAANQLQPEHFNPFVGHPSLKCATVGLGSFRKNEQVEKLLGIPKCQGFKSDFAYV